ncbi:MAG TPA: MarR family transcriptional regulator [Methylovirgula sp.]|jgi:DNA-binding MarR family transcriptional regulator|nr:MarR family transcriptional regulator [Methylovirgula sp.]
MSDETCERPWYETAVIPALLRHARTAYGGAMNAALIEAGCDDIPKNGHYVIGGLAMGAGGVPLGRLAEELGVTKQAAGQLVDTLVLRGYLNRTVDPEDRRKVSITLSERGQLAASVQAAARQRVDAALAAKVGADCVMQMRRGLGVLCAMGRKATEHGA